MSPGVSPDCAILREARAREMCIENDLDILADEIKKPRVVAITGSNGKSTVTTWMGEIAKQAGLTVAVGGNLGTPVLDLWLENPNYDLWVLELSSFQLAAVRHFNITASVILNISPDHLDIHGSMENYIAAKQRIYEFSTNIVFNRDDVNTWPKRSDVTAHSFGLTTPIHDNEWGIIQQGQDYYLARGLEIWIDVQQLKLKGQHNWQNALAVCALANLLGIGKKDIVYVNLQYGDVKEEISELYKNDKVKVMEIDEIDNKNNIDGLLSIIENCDEVVSIDNSTIHFSGSIGKKTEVLLHESADFRWELYGENANWYKSVKLIRNIIL
jgi:UDP-N-acetylmuramoylalanine-D-glutamate ligase